MIKIIVIAPYEEFGELFRETFREHDEKVHNGHAEQGEYEIEVIVEYRHETIQKMKLDCNVVIARGFSAQLLGNMDPYVPVVEIPVTANDIIRCLIESRERYGDRRIAVLATRNIIYQADSLAEMMGLDIQTILMPSQLGRETQNAFEKLKDRDSVILGGKPTCDFARSIGMDSIMIVSGKNAMWQAITEAKRVAYISRIEEEKAQRFKTILDHTFDGIISLDKGNRITAINATCEKILGITTQAIIGRRIEEVLPRSPFSELVSGTDSCLDEVVKHNGIPLAVNKTDIVLKNERVGSVITFQYVSRIQEAEGRIRTKTTERGHVAKHHFSDILGRSERIQATIQMARKFSQVDSNALIVGRSGTGKEIFAQSIHNASRRKHEPFVAINCAAIPENLLESELFGYVEGAFTGAVKKGKQGLIELAHRGTLFLDEISEMPLALQGRLLRVLQEKELMRLGHDRVISVDVRIISATNRDLSDLVEKGKFREDLYYRLDVLKIQLPSLDERKEDIPLLAENFIRDYGESSGDGRTFELTDGAKARLMDMTWGGNIRELKNACERLAVLSETHVIDGIDVERVLDYKPGKTGGSERGGGVPATGPKRDRDFPADLEDRKPERLDRTAMTLENIRDLLKRGYNKTRIAEFYGIDRTTLWRRMKKYKQMGQ
ncbi:MAG: sigma 54-interacting transcriptional regulator [Deltaproteobacteria bacterium]|nr:sigma 54-interacting transcriptional regulator [Deltaproteobacteria bacterium]